MAKRTRSKLWGLKCETLEFGADHQEIYFSRGVGRDGQPVICRRTLTVRNTLDKGEYLEVNTLLLEYPNSAIDSHTERVKSFQTPRTRWGSRVSWQV